MQQAELSTEDAAIVAEELRIHQLVYEKLREAFRKRGLNYHALGEELFSLREEAQKAKADDLPTLFDQMNIQRAIIERTQEKTLPDISAPYFGHMKLEENGKVRDVLLGHQSFLDPYLAPVIDWRHAPVSRIYFNYREGDLYEAELPGRTAEGRMLARRVLAFQSGKLHQIIMPDRTLVRGPDDRWTRSESGVSPVFQGGAGSAQRQLSFGTGLSGQQAPDVSALLDRDQYDILNRDDDEHLLILGGAGCGKTTVALHRIALLNFRDPKRFAAQDIIVIVPEIGLVGLTRKLLDSLNLSKVRASTFDAWVQGEAKKVIRALPERIYPDTPAAVATLKRHPALHAGYPVYVEVCAREMARLLATRLPNTEPAQEVLLKQTDLALWPRFKQAEKAILKSLRRDGDRDEQQTFQKTNATQVFRKLERRFFHTAIDRIDFFGNEDVLRAVQKASQGQLQEIHIKATLKHARRQSEDAAANRYAGIDSDRLETVDGRNLADEAEDEVAGSLDPEDFAFLIDIQWYKTGGKEHATFERRSTYAHMMIDEAQEMSPVELNVLGRALTDDATVTLAGDAAQQTDPSTTFASWESILQQLGVPPVQAQHLKTSYRSTKPIIQFAHDLLGNPNIPLPRAIRDGVPVGRSLLPTDGHAAIFMTDVLTQLMVHEPHASVAVVAKDATYAESVFQALSAVPKIKLVLEGNFDFKPGVDVTDVTQVKGLEFDYVIIPDCSAGRYQDSPIDRRLLHVAATRAIHQLWVISVGASSIILTELQS